MADQQECASAGIYIHIPFCESKCGYCSFVSYPERNDLFDDYLVALGQEIDLYASHTSLKNTCYNTLFIGGGTPTVLAPENLAWIISKVRQSFDISKNPEISVECNPNTLDQEKLAKLKSSGVNRLSIGAQSFDDSTLKSIGRKHRSEDVINAFKLARKSGFNNINLDLICGLPGQTVPNFKDDIENALELKPEHLAVYQLSIDEGTPFEKLAQAGTLKIPSDDIVTEMFDSAEKELCNHGYKKYEISNYSLPGKECRHNLTYWQNDSYLGLGCGAVSFLLGNRIKNSSDPDHFIHKLNAGEFAWDESEALSKEASFRETVIMGLRLINGIEITRLESRYGLNPIDYYNDTLVSLLSQELVIIENGWLRLSETGLPVANQVLKELV